MINKIKENKWSIIFLIILFIILVFCHFQTLILNDDLPYSLFFRVNNRITNISGVLANQLFDYVAISPRIFIHTIVQTLLIFDKNLWSILNPLVIIAIIVLMAYLVKLITKTKVKNIYLILSSTAAFLLLYNYKQLIYWVAGSVNYVWVFLLIILFIIYYLKIGLLKKPILSSLICLILSMICEALAVFVIIMIISDFTIKYFKNKDKNIIFKYVMFLVCAIAGLLFLLLAPSTIGRLTGNDDFNNLSIIGKLLTATPVISAKIFDINLYNWYPLLLFISICYFGFIKKDKKLLISLIPLLIIYVITFIVYQPWLYFIIALYFFGLQIYIFINMDNWALIPILLGTFAIAYFLVLTPEYSAGRTIIHFSLMISVFIMYNLFVLESNTLIIKIITILLVISTIIIEIIIYSYIGQIKDERMAAIKAVQDGKTDVLEVKMMKEPFTKFHIDANNPVDKNYWAWAAFEDYYQLPEDITIKAIE